jgi:hypothetical protein
MPGAAIASAHLNSQPRLPRRPRPHPTCALTDWAGKTYRLVEARVDVSRLEVSFAVTKKFDEPQG